MNKSQTRSVFCLCLALLILLGGCASSPSLSQSDYFFPVEAGTTFQSGGNLLDDGTHQTLFTFEVVQADCDSAIYCLLARSQPSDAELPTGTCYVYFCSSSPFYLELRRTNSASVSTKPTERIEAYSGIARYEVNGQIWYVNDLRSQLYGDFSLPVSPGTLSGGSAKEAPFFSENKMETFLHYLQEALPDN